MYNMVSSTELTNHVVMGDLKTYQYVQHGEQYLSN